VVVRGPRARLLGRPARPLALALALAPPQQEPLGSPRLSSGQRPFPGSPVALLLTGSHGSLPPVSPSLGQPQRGSPRAASRAALPISLSFELIFALLSLWPPFAE
jgi:hypothetical protein